MGFSRQEYWSGLPFPFPGMGLSDVKSLQSCLALCNPMDCSPLGSSVHGILQARILEWVAVLFSRGIFLTQGSNLGLNLHCRHSLPSDPSGKSFRMKGDSNVTNLFLNLHWVLMTTPLSNAHETPFQLWFCDFRGDWSLCSKILVINFYLWEIRIALSIFFSF